MAVLFVCLLLLPMFPRAAETPNVKAFNWPQDTTFEFAIKDSSGKRIATAYYRVLKEQVEGRPVYRFKYVGRNEQISESSECWVYPDTMLPLRSTRKVVSGGRTFYLDVAYGKKLIVVRRKYEGEQVSEVKYPAPEDVFDYESLMWVIPQLEFGQGQQVKLSVFSTLTESLSTVLVDDKGVVKLLVNGKEYDAHQYEFQVSLSPYVYYSVMQNGRAVPAAVKMGDNTFENLKLDPAKQSVKAPPPNDKAKPGQTAKAKPKPKDKPKETPPGENPLGPPPPGGRF